MAMEEAVPGRNQAEDNGCASWRLTAGFAAQRPLLTANALCLERLWCPPPAITLSWKGCPSCFRDYVRGSEKRARAQLQGSRAGSQGMEERSLGR